MASGRDLILASLLVAAAAGVSSLAWEPVESHTLVVCVIMGCGLAVARGRTPSLLPADSPPGFTPVVLGLTLAGLSAALLAGPLHTRGLSVGLQGTLVVLAVPTAEEVLFRGALLRVLPRAPLAAALVSSLLFGALHWKLGWAMVPVMVAVGGILAALALLGRNLVLPVIAHTALNGLATGYREGSLVYVGEALLLAAVIWITALWRSRR